MNCQIFEAVVSDLAREHMIEASARESALVHAGECESCAFSLALERQLTVGLRAVAAEMKSAAASPQLEARLMEAFRCQTSLPAQARGVMGRRYGLVAAAAVVLIALGIGAMSWHVEKEMTIRPETSDRTGAQLSPKPPIVAIGQRDKEPALAQTPAFRRPRRKQTLRSLAKPSSIGNEVSVAERPSRGIDPAAVADAKENEVTTQFLPLKYVSSASLQEGGQLVRVELPRSAMVSFGLPVNMERYGQKVKADVLVSADGLARAIRFVQ